MLIYILESISFKEFYEMPLFNLASVDLWMRREIQLLYAIANCLLANKVRDVPWILILLCYKVK